MTVRNKKDVVCLTFLNIHVWDRSNYLTGANRAKKKEFEIKSILSFYYMRVRRVAHSLLGNHTILELTVGYTLTIFNYKNVNKTS